MRIVSIVGARPQFVKLKPMHEALVQAEFDHVVVHTGQHYDAQMSQAFFDGLSLPDPAVNLEVGSGSHGQQTGRMLEALEATLLRVQPDWVLVYGDTNSTLAGALAAAKIHIRVGHIEAGLRSFNRAMPEEINRIATDHVSDRLFAPTQVALNHLSDEGLTRRTLLTGDVMADLLMSCAKTLRDSDEGVVEPSEPYVVATIHRASNTDHEGQLRILVANLQQTPVAVKLVAHPRLVNAASQYGIALDAAGIEIVEPLPYLEMLRFVANSSGVITDSGGLQKEAYLLGVACTTLRSETEWIETLQDGNNILDPDGSQLAEKAVRRFASSSSNPYGDGYAADRIVADLRTG